MDEIVDEVEKPDGSQPSPFAVRQTLQLSQEERSMAWDGITQTGRGWPQKTILAINRIMSAIPGNTPPTRDIINLRKHVSSRVAPSMLFSSTYPFGSPFPVANIEGANMGERISPG